MFGRTANSTRLVVLFFCFPASCAVLVLLLQVKGAVEEIGKVADYAHRFNRHVAS